MNTFAPPKVVVDSNLLISLLNFADAGHAEAALLSEVLSARHYELLAPVVYLWEMDAHFRHPVKNGGHVQNKNVKLRVTTYNVTSDLYIRTWSEAMVAVKGADRIFVSLAKDHGIALITNDKQILRNASELGVEAISASDFVAKAQC